MEMPMNTIAILERKGAKAYYSEGVRDALGRGTTTATVRKRLATDPDYWQGWHDTRPPALIEFDVNMLEDPTRPGGWITQEERNHD